MSENEMKIIVFLLRNEEYGVNVEQVRSIERMLPITRVPRTPAFVKGVINLRGVVTPVIDLRERFLFEKNEVTDETRIIIVSVQELEVGLVVDAANDVIDLPLREIVAPPELISGVAAKYLSGVAKWEERLLVLLNLEEVLNQEELHALHDADFSYS
ncbi:CheW protein [Fictibacillus macauensis ZFHKF-1]|uniref:Chemotaxis protein CheW n=1 Tax=Fictibacillus macauensis ZFHKF-1 TaxID=1196324 RepID=I8AHC3_9BACL|nr:chemotaxis protein CheW [Fictibacillus macauensis]EIT85102.1 CheW protein [Fictibacillus macauensis ZFHKF-1]